MRWCPENDVPVDIDKHRDMPSPNFRRMMVEIESKALRGQQPLRESELLAIPAQSVVGALPVLKRFRRDLRIDAWRGIALWCIFLDHVPNNIGSWLTLRNYGFSNTAEVFMFLSGVTCAGLRQGKSVRWLAECGQPYAVAKLGHLCGISAAHSRLRHHGLPRRRRQDCRRKQHAHSAGTAGRGARPCSDPAIPPSQLRCLAALRDLSFSIRTVAVVDAANAERNAWRVALLYALVHVIGWSVPAWPNDVWFFNPLAWQLLVVLGAWWVIEGKTFWPWVTSRTALAIAILYLVFGLTIALSWSIGPVVSQMLAELVYPPDKSNLAPLRLLHFVALAILVAWVVPRDWRWLTTPVMRGAIRCGENSLAIYCIGVLLALAGHIVLIDISDGLAMQITLSLAGILVMIAAATFLNSIRIKPAANTVGGKTMIS
jgi:hypothetical protein